jgi:hypothetical protein
VGRKSAAPLLGSFHYDIVEDRWTWSDGMYRIHGMEPGDVVPTTAVLLSHKHPDDVDEYRRLLERVITGGESFTFRHRILDLDGEVRSVITVGEGERSDSGEVTALTGYLLDMTETIREDASALAREVFEQAQEHRANIDQAKGALMVAYGLTDEEAFAVLRWHSQHANLKLRDLAAEMMHRMSVPEMVSLPARAKLSAVLGAITEQAFVIPPDLATPELAALPPERAASSAGEDDRDRQVS